MKSNNETLILEAIQNLEKKVDAITNNLSTQNNGIEPDLIAVITAVAYHLFGKRVAIRNINLLNTGKHTNRVNVIGR